MDDLLPNAAPQTPARAGGGRNVLQILWQHRALVLLGAVAGLTLGVLTYSRRPPVYQASAQLLIVKKQSGSAIISGSADPRERVLDDYVSTHLYVLRSPAIIEAAVRKHNLGALKSLQGGNPVAAIQAGLKAEREVNKDAVQGSTSNIINLSFRGSDPLDAEAVLNAVIDSYKFFLTETYRDTSEKTVELIQTAVGTLTKTREGHQQAYDQFRQKNKLQLTSAGTPWNEVKLLEYVRSETAARDELKALQDRVAQTRQAIQDGKPAALVLALARKDYEKGAAAPTTKPSTSALETALFELAKQEADLATFYEEDYPDLKRVRQRIKMTREHFQKLDEAMAAGTRQVSEADLKQAALNTLLTELVIAESKHRHAKQLLDEETKLAEAQDGLYRKEKELKDGILRSNQALDSTLKRLQDIDTGRGSGGFDAKALAPPAPGFKVGPVLWQFLLMGTALGIALGAGGAYLLDVADKSFRSPDEIRRRLGLALIGHVPFVNKPSAPLTATAADGRTVELDPGLATVHSPMSPEAEAYRGVRTALFFSTHGERHKVIQVTSPNMGDGKTTLIINLAVAIAQSGRKVLLVDADLRRPRVHRAFGVVGRVGLAEVLTGAAEVGDAVQPSPVPNLSVLPCGRRPPNPAELLTTPRFEDVLDDLRAAYDYVLVDTPPLLAVSDPCVVAPRVDGLILTIRVAKNGRPEAERARDLLAGLKANCIGVVVNGVGKQGAMAGYGYDHYRYADEYTTAYTTADHDAHDEEPLAPAPSGADATDLDAVMPVPPVSRVRAHLNGNGNGHAEPSANGTGTGNGH